MASGSSGVNEGDIGLQVIDGVLHGVSDSLKAAGVGEDVIEKFRALWTSKLEAAKEENPTLDLQDELSRISAGGQTSAPKGSAKPKRKYKKKKHSSLSIGLQVDGPNDTSDEEDEDIDKEDEDDDDDDDDDDDENNENDEDDNEEEGVEDEPLGSEDDISDEDPSELFDTANVVVCQYDKITRIRNKWKFHLKDGIMNLNGKDYVFQRATGDAEW